MGVTRGGDQDDEGGGLDRRWHLATTPYEESLTEFEFALMRVREAFDRWQSECLAAAGGPLATGAENALLHVIRLHDRAKPLKELARLTNRDDVPNLQYALRKLARLGLIRQSGARNNAVYSLTAAGVALTDRYAALRQRLLVEFTETVAGVGARMEQASQMLNLMSGVYEQAARVAATHQRGMPSTG